MVTLCVVGRDCVWEGTTDASGRAVTVKVVTVSCSHSSTALAAHGEIQDKALLPRTPGHPHRARRGPAINAQHICTAPHDDRARSWRLTTTITTADRP